jgi:hypothetical protein
VRRLKYTNKMEINNFGSSDTSLNTIPGRPEVTQRQESRKIGRQRANDRAMAEENAAMMREGAARFTNHRGTVQPSTISASINMNLEKSMTIK